MLKIQNNGYKLLFVVGFDSKSVLENISSNAIKIWNGFSAIVDWNYYLNLNLAWHWFNTKWTKMLLNDLKKLSFHHHVKKLSRGNYMTNFTFS